MDKLTKLSFVVDNIQPGIFVGEQDYYNTVSSFPNPLKQTIKDYVHAHFDVIKEDGYSIRFVE